MPKGSFRIASGEPIQNCYRLCYWKHQEQLLQLPGALFVRLFAFGDGWSWEGIGRVDKCGEPVWSHKKSGRGEERDWAA